MSASAPPAANEFPCRYLDWDSSFFGLRIARAAPHTISSASLDSIQHWCELQRIDCLYFLAAADDRETLALLEQAGFRFVDIRMTLACELNVHRRARNEGVPGIRPARPSDIPALTRIARVSHRDSRFYYDGRFSSERCDALYETWIEKSCRGYADIVLVAESDGLAVGYISCHLKEDAKAGPGEIGLLAISTETRGRGIGSNLVAAALEWFSNHGATRVSVVTQGRNVAAQKLYQRSNFVTESVELWYHKWFDPGQRG